MRNDPAGEIMTTDVVESDYSPRLERLLGYLERDPGNLSLLGDAAAAAFEDRAFDEAEALLGRIAAQGPLSPPMLNLAGLLALARQRFEDAATLFEQLIEAGHAMPEVRFNRAWALAMTGRYEEAEALLDEETIAASPRGPALKIHMLHHLEQYDEALALGAELAERYPDNEALMGALATLAMDAEQVDLARQYAERAGDSAEGLAARGMFTLEGPDSANALPMFDQAIAQQPRNPRAWMGRGLSLLMAEDRSGAVEAIDKAAELFGTHLGSWIASGWAHFMNGDQLKARQSFERALAIDGTFSETHGGLAVMDIMAGDIDSAKRNCEIALKLDRASFGGALAQMLLLNQAGDHEKAARIRDIALSTPIGPDGKTIAQALVSMGYKG